jgi:hypothetical protein
MFGLISAGVSLAGLGMSAMEAIKANREMKKQESKTNALLNQAEAMAGTNVLAGMSGADVSSTQTQAINQQTAQGIQALQGMGPEAAIGGTANMLQGQAASMAGVTQAQAQEDQRVKEMIAAQEQANIDKKMGILDYRVGAATNAQQQAAAARSSAVEGMFGSALGALQYAKSDFDPDTGKYVGTKWGQGQDDSSKMATLEDAKKAGLTEEQISAIQKMFGV